MTYDVISEIPQIKNLKVAVKQQGAGRLTMKVS